MHIFHKWEVVYRYDLDNRRGWFEHRKCKVCSKEQYIDHLNIYSSFVDAIGLGVSKGVYKALHGKGYNKKEYSTLLSSLRGLKKNKNKC